MIRFIIWNRIEPVSRSQQLDRALEARIHDPLWLLGRQWQFGELQGEDVGPPVTVRLQLSSAPLDRWRAGDDGPPEPYDPASAPLEAQVEREPSPRPTFRAAADAGVHFLRLLRQHGHAAEAGAGFADAFPLAEAAGADRPEVAAIRAVLDGRVPNGVALAAALRTARSGLPAQARVDPRIAGDVQAAATAWLAWYDAEVEPTGAGVCWVDGRLEYHFAVAGPTSQGETVLAAPAYLGGTLDWHDVSAVPDGTLQPTEDDRAAPAERVVHALPTSVDFPGMPADRFWQFEDAAVSLPSVDVAPDDLGRLALIEFATVFGNDWFVVPAQIDYGTLTEVASLVVRDTFGEQLLVRHTNVAAGGGWRMFDVGAHSPLLFLPPVVATALEGGPLEQVLFLRDEMANLVWAVEKIIEGDDRHGRRRDEEYAALVTATPAESIADLVYRLSTSVPEHWIPFVPVHDESGRGVRLHRAAMLRFGEGPPVPVLPAGRVLRPEAPSLVLFEEEVPRAGVRVDRVPAMCRWIEGSIHAWVGRRVSNGRGEGSSGLRFDVAKPPLDTEGPL